MGFLISTIIGIILFIGFEFFAGSICSVPTYIFMGMLGAMVGFLFYSILAIALGFR